MLRDLAESVYELREARRAKRKAKRDAAKKARKEATRTGAEEQRELEYLAMLAQQGEREAMASEDARSMAWEIQVRAEKMLRESRQNELRERAYCAAREAEQLELIRQDGLYFRFQRTATMYRWRDSTELFESYDIGCTVRQFSVLSADDLSRIPAGVLAGEPLVLTGSSPIKRDVVLAACGDGAVRLVVYSLQRNKTSTGSSFVVGRAPDEIPVLGACLVRSGALQRKLGWLVLYACGDGFIRCGWDHWKQLYRANIGGPAPPKDPPPTDEDQEEDGPWQASLPQLAPLEDDQPDHDDVIYGLAVHRDVLFSWSADGRIKKWCLDTGELLHTYCGTRGGVTTCIVSANGKFLLSAGDTSDPRIRLWDAQYMPPGHAGHADHTPDVECDAPESSPDCGEPTFYDHACDGCDRARRVMLAEHKYQKRADVQMALYRKAGKNDGATTGARLEHLLEDAREAVDEQALRNVADFARYHGGALRIFHEHRADYVGVDGPGSHGEWINGLCLNASETLAASCGSDTFAKIWRFPEGDIVSRVKCDDWIMTCAMGTISDFQDLPIEVLVTGCADSTITIWDAHSGSPLQTLRGHSDAVADVCFLHQGRFASQKKTSASSATVDTDPVGETIYDTDHDQDLEVSNNDKDDGETTCDKKADTCSTVKMAQNDEVKICNFVRSSSYDGTIRTWKLGSGLPFAPPPPVVESTRQTEATIQWEMPVQNGSPVLEFHIKQRENKIDDFEVVALVKVNTKENLTTFKRRMTALHPGSSYEFCVAASSEIGQGGWSLASEPRRCQPAMPGRIDAPIVTHISTTSMTISWIAPDSMGAHIQEFAIRRRGGTSSRTFEESQEVLVSWQDARAGAEKERNAATARRRTLEAWLHENRHLGAKETLRMRRKLKDEDNLDNQRRVLVQVAMSATGSAATRKGITAEQLLEMSATLTGLESGMAYQFSVIAVNKIGRGPWSLPSTSASTSTCAPDAPGEAPWLQSTSTTSLTLAWMPPRTNGSALTAFVFRYGKAAVVDEMLQCETDEDTHASKARGFLESSKVQAATDRVERATAAMHSKHVVEMKMAGVLSDADFEVLRVALYVMMHVSGDAGDEDDTDADADADKRSSKLLHPLPRRLEVNAAVRHPEQFLGRLRSFRLATRDAELGEKLRPAIVPLCLPVINLVTDLGKKASALKLTLSRMLLTWLEAVVEYDGNVYKNTIFPVLAEATCAWRRRREILGSGLSTLRVGGKATHTTVEGLEAGEAYRFQFCAVNDQGTSGFSPASRSFVVKRGPPSMPLEVTASHPSTFRLTVAWAAPEQLFGSQVIAYHVVFRQAGRGAFVTAQTVSGSQRELQVSGLQPDTLYEFAVTAENEVGRGPRSEVSIPTRTLPAQVPSAVTVPIILSADFRAVRLHWKAPSSDGGMPVLRFIVNAFRGTERTPMGTCAMLEQVSPADSYFVDIFPGVQTAGEGGDAFFMEDEIPYSFCVLAENHVGLSLPSEPSAAVVIARPGTEL